eukprot:TRINITY_DN55_c1_g1_i2.p5 TRINITY_DN55_c1_g1~~TRINITY_DN55_c1_g1_i2.p5  ORF type:complete len:102 (-),score=7.02 TRINITY_DN55_c1_g1_i2:254-559(-)
MSSSVNQNIDGGVLKAARQQCYEAKDRFYNCCAKIGHQFTYKGEIPQQCLKEREEFKALCRDTWVTHFDKLHDKFVRLDKTKQQREEALKNQQGTTTQVQS